MLIAQFPHAVSKRILLVTSVAALLSPFHDPPPLPQSSILASYMRSPRFLRGSDPWGSFRLLIRELSRAGGTFRMSPHISLPQEVSQSLPHHGTLSIWLSSSSYGSLTSRPLANSFIPQVRGACSTYSLIDHHDARLTAGVPSRPVPSLRAGIRFPCPGNRPYSHESSQGGSKALPRVIRPLDPRDYMHDRVVDCQPLHAASR